MINEGIKRLFTSLPILDPSYPYNDLLSAVTAIRKVRAGSNNIIIENEDLKEYMKPEVALKISCATLEFDPPPHSEVSDGERELIDDSIERIKNKFPEWSLPFSLNVSFLKLPDGYGAISGSAQKWPQHILLSSEAMNSTEIEEQLIHEFCHQWQYMIQEILPTNKFSRDQTLILPSGTADRAPSEVLGAGHVAATLVNYYRVVDPPQVKTLLDYASGCNDILIQNADRLSESGTLLSSSLNSWIERNS